MERRWCCEPPFGPRDARPQAGSCSQSGGRGGGRRAAPDYPGEAVGRGRDAPEAAPLGGGSAAAPLSPGPRGALAEAGRAGPSSSTRAAKVQGPGARCPPAWPGREGNGCGARRLSPAGASGRSWCSGPFACGPAFLCGGRLSPGDPGGGRDGQCGRVWTRPIHLPGRLCDPRRAGASRPLRSGHPRASFNERAGRVPHSKDGQPQLLGATGGRPQAGKPLHLPGS